MSAAKPRGAHMFLGKRVDNNNYLILLYNVCEYKILRFGANPQKYFTAKNTESP